MYADAPRIFGNGVGLGDLGPKRRNCALIDDARAVKRSVLRNIRSALGIIISRHCSCLRAEANPLTTVIHGVDAIATFGENFANSGISKLVELKPEQAGHDLQVVLHPMMNFRE